MLGFWSYSRLAREYGKAQLDLGVCLDAVILYALSLERQVDLTPSLKINVGQTVEEILVSDRTVALALAKLVFEGKPGLANEIVAAFEPLRAWRAFLDQQLELVRQMGLAPYLSLMAEPGYRSVHPSATV
jgi:bacterioferritin (cytochrome b1)